MDNLFFVQHLIEDKEKWASFMGKWMDIMGAEGMTVDKVLAYPEFEGNECILSCPESTGNMHYCIWKMPMQTTKKEFQEFIDRFTCGAAINEVSAVDKALGIKPLSARLMARDWILAANGQGGVGYLDKPMLWMTIHKIKDKKGWETEVMQGMTTAVREKCNTPSDCGSLGPEGYGTALVLFLNDDKCICIDGTPAGVTHGEYQKLIDDFTKGTAQNDIYVLNTKEGAGTMYLSEDQFNQDMLKWGESYVNPFTKTASHEATHPVMRSIDLTSQ